MLRNLPVIDPNILIRLGDTDDRCVNSGMHEKGDYAPFSTETCSLRKKNLPIDPVEALRVE